MIIYLLLDSRKFRFGECDFGNHKLILNQFGELKMHILCNKLLLLGVDKGTQKAGSKQE
jgi:hypothetical protein